MKSVATIMALSLLALTGALTACRGGSNGNTTTIYTLGGTVSELVGSLVLQNNGGDDLTISTGGTFAFATSLPDATAYVVSVLTQPVDQTCTVTNGSGTISGAAVTNVGVGCVPSSFKLQLGLDTIGTDAAANDYGHSLVLDTEGNTFVVAETFGSLGEAFAGGRDIVLSKVNSSGTLQWVKQYGNVTIGAGASGTERIFGMAMDGAGNIVIVGTTSGNLGETNAGSSDAYVLKVSPIDGAVIWITQFGDVSVGPGASAAENVKGVDVDSSGNIYISGRTAGNLDETNAGGQDLFTAKLDSNGMILWITQLGSVTVGANANDDDTTYGGLVVDAIGDTYITGTTRGDLAEANLGSGSTYDMLVYKLDTFGALLWITQLGSITAGAGSGFNDYDQGIALDASGNVYAVGQTSGAVGEANGGSSDGFIFKLDSSGNLKWIRQYGSVTVGAGASMADAFYAVDVGSDNNIYVAGSTAGDFAETNANFGTTDIIAVKLDSNGNTIFTKQLGNETLGPAAAGSDRPSTDSLMVDNNNEIYVTGSTNGDLFESNAGLNDIFLFKLNKNGDI